MAIQFVMQKIFQVPWRALHKAVENSLRRLGAQQIHWANDAQVAVSELRVTYETPGEIVAVDLSDKGLVTVTSTTKSEIVTIDRGQNAENCRSLT